MTSVDDFSGFRNIFLANHKNEFEKILEILSNFFEIQFEIKIKVFRIDNA